MSEVTLHLDGNASKSFKVHADWFDKNGVHHDTEIALHVYKDELNIMINKTALCAVLPNGKVIYA